MVVQKNEVALVDVQAGQLGVRIGEDPAAAVLILQQDVAEDGLAFRKLFAAVQLLVDAQNAIGIHTHFLLRCEKLCTYYKAQRSRRQLDSLAAGLIK